MLSQQNPLYVNSSLRARGPYVPSPPPLSPPQNESSFLGSLGIIIKVKYKTNNFRNSVLKQNLIRSFFPHWGENNNEKLKGPWLGPGVWRKGVQNCGLNFYFNLTNLSSLKAIKYSKPVLSKQGAGIGVATPEKHPRSSLENKEKGVRGKKENTLPFLFGSKIFHSRFLATNFPLFFVFKKAPQKESFRVCIRRT